MYKKYSDYTTSDFAADESFRKWVKDKTQDDELDQYWSSFRLRYPHKASMMDEAERLVLGVLRAQQHHVVGNPHEVWQRVRQQTLQQNQETAAARTVSLSRVWLRYAATIIFLAMVGGTLWFYTRPATMEWATANGEQRTIELPDHSVIHLGTNSHISYRRDWSDETSREVWMRGEGRFIVQHLNQDTTHITNRQRFIVHVENQLDVEVLGTVFTIRNRRGKTHVALESGAIQVSMNDKVERLTHSGQFVDAIPAQARFEVAEQEIPAIQEHEGMLTLENMAVSEIIEVLEDTYGITIDVRDASLLSRKVDGALPLNDESLALAALSSILHVNAIRHDSVVTLEPQE